MAMGNHTIIIKLTKYFISQSSGQDPGSPDLLQMMLPYPGSIAACTLIAKHSDSGYYWDSR